MANRRMCSKAIMRSDSYLSMPHSARQLYDQLVLDADDRGYVNSVKAIMRLIGCSSADLKILINKRFILQRGKSLIIIKGWRLFNNIQPSRLVETNYIEDFKKLYLDENGSYTEKPTNFSCRQIVVKMST